MALEEAFLGFRELAGEYEGNVFSLAPKAIHRYPQCHGRRQKTAPLVPSMSNLGRPTTALRRPHLRGQVVSQTSLAAGSCRHHGIPNHGVIDEA